MRLGILMISIITMAACTRHLKHESTLSSIDHKQVDSIVQYPIIVLDDQVNPIKDAEIFIMCGKEFMPSGKTDVNGKALIDMSQVAQPFLLWVTCPYDHKSINMRFEYPPPSNGITVLLACSKKDIRPIEYIAPGPMPWSLK